jgi:uncharacterized protein DUF7019
VSFQYYLYVSDSKVDMLLPQIDPGRVGRHTTEVVVTLKIFSAKRSVESSAEVTRFARLERVVRHLQDFGDLGPIDAPGQFFGGIMPVRWGSFHGTSLVYFGGETERTVVGLGGSGRHVLGTSGNPDDHAMARSVMPSLLDGLAVEPEIGDLLGVGTGADEDVLRAVELANAGLRGPDQNVEFVAKRLLHGRLGTKEVVLGTPLYVALVD